MILHNLMINPGLFFGERGDKRKRGGGEGVHCRGVLFGQWGKRDGDKAPGQVRPNCQELIIPS